jgi:ferric-dicitrate binding protein FerR (iron transport regulator)
LAKKREHLDSRSQILRQYWQTGRKRQQADKEKVFARLMDRISEAEERDDKIRQLPPIGKSGRNTHIIRSFLKYASILLLMAASSLYLFRGLRSDYLESLNKEITNEVIQKFNPRGRMSTHILSDGTKIKLNAESKLEYPKFFAEDRREVRLIGEAWFEVAEDSIRPFIITSGKLQTTVLGTEFNVRAFPDDDQIEVALLNGKVEVMMPGKEQDSRVELKPKEMLIYDRIDQEWLSKSFDPEIELVWKDGTILFDDANLNEVITTLERWYGVTIKVRNGRDRNVKISSTQYDNAPLDEVLMSLGFMSNFNWRFADKEHKVIIIDFES